MRQGLEIDDSQSDAYGIGVLRDLNNQTRCPKVYEKAINLDPENPEYWSIFAEFSKGKITQAEMLLKVVNLTVIDAWIDYSNFLFETPLRLGTKKWKGYRE